ncbi:MAG: potassium transporter Kup [Gammaproteobacteria bacterium]|nr:potassium transporter Kup [Gammaproteobacteria bacterium]
MTDSQDQSATEPTAHDHSPTAPLPLLAIGAIGVVFGDIGTSPLYALRELFNPIYNLPATPANVLGALSLILWSLLLMVSLKYVLLMMRADNNGEGGIMALLSLTRRVIVNKRGRRLLAALGLLGAAMFYGDSMITPAISVLSAVEGLEVVTPALSHYVIPVALLMLMILFFAQRQGTENVSRYFGPVMCVWFAVLAVLGITKIIEHPTVLAAVSPLYAVDFIAHHGITGLLVLGAVVLVITGGEALYADMGHFGKRAIRMAWFCYVLPALLLNYFGQGALIISEPEAISNPFYLLFPDWLLWPIILLATAATIIASQAVISGAFSLTRQAMQIDFCPRVDVVYTSDRTQGQIYVPVVNWMLFTAVVCLVIMFGESSELASAYGLAVTITMLIDTLLFIIVMRRIWRVSLPLVVVFSVIQLALDSAFLAATSAKIEEGGWFPLLVGGLLFLLLSTWQRGRALLRRQRAAEALDLDPMLDAIAGEVTRVPGTAVFFTTSTDKVPRSLMHNLKHNKVLHERVLLLTLYPLDTPYCSDEERVKVTPLRHNFYRIEVSFGYMDFTDLPVILQECARFGLKLDQATTSYFISRETIIVRGSPEMGTWRQRIFALLSRVATPSVRTLRLPSNQVLELGAQIRL